MTLRLAKHLTLSLLLLAAVSACDQGRKAPPKTVVRVVNAAPSFTALEFRREETSGSSLDFKSGTEFSYDVDSYDFHVEVRPSTGSAPERVASFAKTLAADTSYTVVLTESAGAVQPVVLEHPTPAANATEAQILALHAAPGAPAVDLYIEPAGAVIGAATPRGTLDLGATLAPRNIAAGDYQVTLTTAGNAADVLLSSATFTLAAGSTTSFVVAAESGETNAPLSVLASQASAIALYDRNATSAIRVINGATDGAPRDVAIDGQFAPPLFPAAPFAAETGFLPVTGGEHTVNVTPVGNPGALELNQSISPAAPQLYTLIFSGDAGALTHAIVPESARRLARDAKLRFFNVARQFTTLDIFLVNQGVDISQAAPLTAIGTPGASSTVTLPPGTYDIVMRQTGTANVVAGPQSVTVAAGGIYSVLAINGPDTATATIVLLDDF
jgi:hypothetical protein